MLLKDISVAVAERLMGNIRELRPGAAVEITAADPVLQALGFADSVVCTLRIDMTDEELDELQEEINQMEIDAYNFSDEDMKDPAMRKLQRELEERYSEFALLQAALEKRIELGDEFTL